MRDYQQYKTCNENLTADQKKCVVDFYFKFHKNPETLNLNYCVEHAQEKFECNGHIELDHLCTVTGVPEVLDWDSVRKS